MEDCAVAAESSDEVDLLGEGEDARETVELEGKVRG